MPKSPCLLGAIVLLILQTTVASTTCGYAGGAPTVTINAGVVIGTTTSIPSATATVNKFLGIPFAKTPPERFARPESPGNFSQPINATAWSPACIQQFPWPKAAAQLEEMLFNTPPPGESEDCLYLNVYAPSTPAPADGRTVMYWIYGGSLQFGTAGMSLYDGSFFAAFQDVIVVSVNYRTNVFGFPSSPELPSTGHNLGFWDQRMGLEWVQQNIAAFGGSPEKVTIFGESAGAESVDAMLTSHPAGSHPPFRGAILESDTISYGTLAVWNEGESRHAWRQLIKLLGCPGNYSSDLACARAAPALKIKHLIDVHDLLFNPIPDNVTLVSDGAARRAAGNIAYIPAMGGTNAQEGRVFTIGDHNTTAYLMSYVGQRPELIKQIEAAYPLGQDHINTQYERIAQILTDVHFQFQLALWANATAEAGIPCWRYYFNASFINTQIYPDLGVFHSSEIPMVFGTYSTQNLSTQEYALSKSMQSAWAAFAKNPMGGPGWNRVGTGAVGKVLSDTNQMVVGGDYADSKGSVDKGFWDLGVWGNVGHAWSSGITVVDQYTVDTKIPLWREIYKALSWPL